MYHIWCSESELRIFVLTTTLTRKNRFDVTELRFVLAASGGELIPDDLHPRDNQHPRDGLQPYDGMTRDDLQSRDGLTRGNLHPFDNLHNT